MRSAKTYNVFNTYGPGDKRLPDKNKLKGIYEIGKQICAMTDPNEIIENIIDLISQLLPFERCIIARKDDEGIVPIVHDINDLPRKFVDWPISRSIIKRVIETQEAILGIDGQDMELNSAQNESIEAKGIKSFICTFLRIGIKGKGVIYIDSTITNACFEDNDFFFLAALTSYIQLALKNANTICLEKAKSNDLKQQYTQMVKQSIIGKSKEIQGALSILEKVAITDEPVLILGERGTGKELFAKAVHDLSKRASNPYKTLNVTTIPTNLIESELFGYEPGAFTGAIGRKKKDILRMLKTEHFFLMKSERWTLLCRSNC